MNFILKYILDNSKVPDIIDLVVELAIACNDSNKVAYFLAYWDSKGK